MRYFDYIPEASGDRLFFRPPQTFTKTSERDFLRAAVGALLYTPAVNPKIAQIILDGKVPGLASMAICLEDAVGDRALEEGIVNMERQLALLLEALQAGRLAPERLPLLFVRVKDTALLERLANCFVRYSRVLTGAILPKVTLAGLEGDLSLVAEIARRSEEPFYAMPILESPELMYVSDRMDLLRAQRDIIDRFYQTVLNIRVGGTDLCGLYGIRRAVDTSIYQIRAVSACLEDVLRVFALEDRYTVSGPVWEYYSPPEHVAAPEHSEELRGLLREVHLDLQNGMMGKTCLHPTQLAPVQASYTLPHELYRDALALVAESPENRGAMASERHNKMNEVKPHSLWARKMLRRAAIYGVYHADADHMTLLRSLDQEEAMA